MLLFQMWFLDGYQSVKFVTSHDEISPEIESERTETPKAIWQSDFMSAQSNNKTLSLEFVFLFHFS